MSLARIAACLTAIFLAAPVMAQTRSAFEVPAALPGATLAPQALLRGPHHKVAEPVRVEGFLGRFEI